LRLVLSAFGSDSAGLAPALEVALDHLSVGACTCKCALRSRHDGLVFVEGGLEAELLASGGLELVTAARDVAVGGGELRRGDEPVAGGDRGGQCLTGLGRPSACRIES